MVARLLLLALPLFSLPALAQVSEDAKKTNVRVDDGKLVTYEELCTYESACSRLQNPDGSMITPKASVKKLVELMAESLIDYGKAYGVDPRAAAGSILAENTLNVQIDDSLQNFLVKFNVPGNKKLLKEGMSIGPGQINLAPAMAADAYIASIGIRRARSREEISQRLLTLDGAAEYATAIVRQARDAFLAQDIDISQRTDILATLYNSGGYDERALAAKERGKPSRPNYFGFFVGQNIAEVEETIGWSPERGKFKRAITESVNVDALMKATKPVTLYAAPPRCRTEGAGMTGEWNARTSWTRFEEFKPKSSEFLQITGQTVDCQLRDWVQVTTSRGEIGWLPRVDLHTSAKEWVNWRMHGRCEAPGTCLAEVEKKIGQKSLGSDQRGRYFLPLQRMDKNDPLDINKYTNPLNCGPYAEMKKNINGENEEARRRSILPRETILEYAKAAVVRRDQINALLNFNKEDYGGGYASVINHLAARFLECLDNERIIGCYILSEEKPIIDKLLNTDYSKTRKLSDLTKLISRWVRGPIVFEPRDPSEEKSEKELADEKKKNQEDLALILKELRGSCAALKGPAPKIHAELFGYFDEMEKYEVNAENLKNDASYLSQVCDQIWFLDEHQRTGKFPDGSEKPNCEFYVEEGDQKSLINYSMEFLSKLEFSEEEYRPLLAFNLESLKSLSLSAKAQFVGGNNSSFSAKNRLSLDEDRLMGCNYNPLATVKTIEKLNEDPCVETVLVPDMDLSKGLAVVPTFRVVQDRSMPGDRFAITFRGGCQTELKSRPREKNIPDLREKK